MGIVAGAWLSLFPLGELGAKQIVSSKLALAVTAALFISAVGHWAYVMLSTGRECQKYGNGGEKDADNEVV